MSADEREKALVEAAKQVLSAKGDRAVYRELHGALRQALKAYAAYPTMCLAPELCALKGYCPREIACDD